MYADSNTFYLTSGTVSSMIMQGSTRSSQAAYQIQHINKLKPLRSIEEATFDARRTLPQEYPLWQQDWHLLFEASVAAPAEGQFDAQGYVASLAQRLCDLTASNRKSLCERLEFRFLTLFMYDLHVLYNGKRSVTSSARERLTTFLTIGGQSGQLQESVSSLIVRWIKAGSHYCMLTTMLGGRGALFHLPTAVAESFWSSQMPLSGPTNAIVTEFLQGIGISDAARSSGANDVAERIRSGLLSPCRWNSILEGGSRSPARSSASANLEATLSPSPSESADMFPMHDDLASGAGLPLQTSAAAHQRAGQSQNMMGLFALAPNTSGGGGGGAPLDTVAHNWDAAGAFSEGDYQTMFGDYPGHMLPWPADQGPRHYPS